MSATRSLPPPDIEEEDTLVMDSPIKMVRSDVTITKLEPEWCQDCETNVPATHAVWMEIRATGMTHCVTKACRKHAMEAADRIQSSLPESEGE